MCCYMSASNRNDSSDSCNCCCRTIAKKIKPLHIFTNISQQSIQHNFIRCSWAYRKRISQCSCKNSMTLSSFSRTFHDLCCFPWLSRPGKWFSKISWLSMTSGHPELYTQWWWGWWWWRWKLSTSSSSSSPHR